MSKGFKFTFLAAASWAIAIILTKFIFRLGENPYNLAFWTSVLGAPYMFYLLMRSIKDLKKLKTRDYLILVGIALVTDVGVSFSESFALKYGLAINFSFLIRTVILFTMLFAYLFLGEKFTPKKLILAILILSGAYLLTSNGQAIRLSRGDVFTLIEAALIALGNNVLGKMATNRMPPNLSASFSTLLGLIPIAIISHLNQAIALPKSWPLLLAVTVIGLMITLFRYRGLKYSSATYVTMIFSFTPVLVSFMAVPLLKETLSPIQILGGVLIVLAGVAVEKLKI